MDIFNLEKPVLCLVNIKDRLSIAPDIIFQVPIDPSRISPSKQLIHFDQRTQHNSDLHGWFQIEKIHVVEEIGPCDSDGQLHTPSELYWQRQEQKQVA